MLLVLSCSVFILMIFWVQCALAKSEGGTIYFFVSMRNLFVLYTGESLHEVNTDITEYSHHEEATIENAGWYMFFCLLIVLVVFKDLLHQGWANCGLQAICGLRY